MNLGLGLGFPFVRSFTPLSLGDVELWLRADRGITLVSGNISEWDDQSGKGDSNRNAAQASGPARPAFVASDATYGGSPLVSGTVNQFLSTGTWASAIPQPFTLFAVGQCDNSLCFALQGATDEASFDASSGWRALANGTGITVAATTTNPAVLIGVFNGASSSLRVSRATKSTGSVGTSSVDIMGLLGAPSGGGTGNAKLAEIALISRALSDADAALLNAYASTRYGITIGS